MHERRCEIGVESWKSSVMWEPTVRRYRVIVAEEATMRSMTAFRQSVAGAKGYAAAVLRKEESRYRTTGRMMDAMRGPRSRR